MKREGGREREREGEWDKEVEGGRERQKRERGSESLGEAQIHPYCSWLC